MLSAKIPIDMRMAGVMESPVEPLTAPRVVVTVIDPVVTLVPSPFDPVALLTGTHPGPTISCSHATAWSGPITVTDWS